MIKKKIMKFCNCTYFQWNTKKCPPVSSIFLHFGNKLGAFYKNMVNCTIKIETWLGNLYKNKITFKLINKNNLLIIRALQLYKLNFVRKTRRLCVHFINWFYNIYILVKTAYVKEIMCFVCCVTANYLPTRTQDD